MKKNQICKLMLCLTAVLTVICFAGCADKEEDEKKEQTYYVELGEIKKDDYNSLLAEYSNITSPTYAQLKEARATLKTYHQYDFDSNTGFKRSELYNFFIRHGFTPSEANSALDNLDSRGNSLGFYSSSSEYKIYWAYAEKE